MTSTISDEQVNAAVEAFRHGIAVEGMVFDMRHAVAMRAALEAYEAARAPDPRVVELVKRAKRIDGYLPSASTSFGNLYSDEIAMFRAALAAMENGNG